MKSTKSNRPSGKSRRVKPLTLEALLDAPSELASDIASSESVVLMTRIRLARNLAATPFPGWAGAEQREDAYETCRAALTAVPGLKRGLSLSVSDLSDLEKQILVERHLISRELSDND